MYYICRKDSSLKKEISVICQLRRQSLKISSMSKSIMYHNGVLATFIKFAMFHINYGKSNEFLYARCLLDNVCTRIDYELAITSNSANVDEIIQEQKERMHIEEILTD